MINNNMTIGDILERYPYAADIMLQHGIHCVGCGAANFETIEQGILGHGKSRDDLDTVVNEINDLIDEMTDAIFVISERASKTIMGVLEDEGGEDILRISVIPGGCSGFQYEFSFKDETIQDTDTVVESAHGLKVLINEKSLPLLKGSRLDYVMSVQGAGLKIYNPNSTSNCGCGSSFS